MKGKYVVEYIETTEKIQNLKPLDDLIYKIKDLLEQHPGQKHHNDGIEFWIAGGAVLSAITDKPTADYDIYSSNPVLMIERLRSLVDACNEYEHGMFSHLRLDNKIIQITTQAFKTPAEILDKYDFTIVSAAYDGKTLIHHPRFWQDVATKTIHIIRVFFPTRELRRVIKYTSRGYTPTVETMDLLMRSFGTVK